MNIYEVTYKSYFIPSEGNREGNIPIWTMLVNDNEKIEACSEDEAKQIGQKKIAEKNFKDEKGYTEYSVSSVYIIKWLLHKNKTIFQNAMSCTW